MLTTSPMKWDRSAKIGVARLAALRAAGHLGQH